MDKIIWNIEKTVAIPLSNIKALKIEWQTHNNVTICKVKAYYQICTGECQTVFQSDNIESCQAYIEDIYLGKKVII